MSGPLIASFSTERSSTALACGQRFFFAAEASVNQTQHA
jgi:hypothetical protein